MHLAPPDWQRLRALRDRFLTDAREDYWTARDLELYDAVFAPRIGWKWSGALASLDRAGWRPASARLLDWGCGTGIAARVVAEWTRIREAEVFDQSPLAAAFAARSLEAAGLSVQTRGGGEPIPPGTLLVLSHVAGELDDAELADLAAFAASAEEILWVEPGSREISRRLGAAREILRAAGHRFAGPCTHAETCPMLDPENERHWCHFFAKPPVEIFQSAFWRDVSHTLEIDLRSLPYSFVAASRIGVPDFPAGAERLIGRARELKAHVEFLGCGTAGLHPRMLQKRDEPALFRLAARHALDGVFTWELDPEKPGRIRRGKAFEGRKTGGGTPG